MTISFVRTIIIYLVVTVALRVMGKRQIGELSPAEFVITMLVSELAAIPLQSTEVPIAFGIVPVLTLLSLEIIMSSLFLKSRFIRKIAVGKTSILIENGEINQNEMKKLRLTIDELLEELRLKGFIDVKQVKYAILEANGELSVFPFSKDSPATKSDLKINSDTTYLPRTVISDGILIESEMKNLKLTKKQVEKELKKQKIDSISEVFLMQSDENKNILIVPKEKRK